MLLKNHQDFENLSLGQKIYKIYLKDWTESDWRDFNIDEVLENK
jgi:hypothetical protein